MSRKRSVPFAGAPVMSGNSALEMNVTRVCKGLINYTRERRAPTRERERRITVPRSSRAVSYKINAV